MTSVYSDTIDVINQGTAPAIITMGTTTQTILPGGFAQFLNVTMNNASIQLPGNSGYESSSNSYTTACYSIKIHDIINASEFEPLGTVIYVNNLTTGPENNITNYYLIQCCPIINLEIINPDANSNIPWIPLSDLTINGTTPIVLVDGLVMPLQTIIPFINQLLPLISNPNDTEQTGPSGIHNNFFTKLSKTPLLNTLSGVGWTYTLLPSSANFPWDFKPTSYIGF